MSHSKAPVVRAAPSPTGKKHIGNLRTFLYNYLYAKKHDGTFILRVEDTDRERLMEGGVDAILEMMKLYGMESDEDPVNGGPNAPYLQSERIEIYQKYAEELLESGHAYKCFCSKERLEELRKMQEDNGEPTGYDGHCRDLSAEKVRKNLENGEEYVIRMKFPKDGETRFEDIIFGKSKFKNYTIDDQVLIKSDGYPTYHYGVVIDDHLMGITHVLRGREYFADTPKNLFLYEAFGWEPPKFAHVTHILNPSGKGKLSTREGALYALSYLRKGYLKEAMLNYVALAGWYPKEKDQNQDEIYSMEEMIEIFEFEDIQKNNARFDQKKLDYIQGKHVRNLSLKELAEKVFYWAENLVIADFAVDELYEREDWEKELKEKVEGYLIAWKADKDKFLSALELLHDRVGHFSEIPDLIEFMYTDELKWSDEDWRFKNHDKNETAEALNSLKANLAVIYAGPPDHDAWEEVVRATADEIEWKHGDMFMALRSAVTGRLQSPPLYESIEVIGWEKASTFIEQAIDWLKS